MTRQLEIKQPFDLELSLTMGQAFRWRELGDGWFSGVLGENLVHIRQTDGGVEYRVGGAEGERPANRKDDEMLRRYFREDDDVAAIYEDIRSRDERIKRLVKQYRGMRVLRQDPWECFVSYICSRSNSIERISQCVAALSKELGDPLTIGDETRVTFPTPERIATSTEEQLLELKFGFRARSVVVAASRVADSGIDLANFKMMSYQNAKERLMQYDGIGDKIADCIALMSLDKLEAFPVDRHIRRLVNDWWFGLEKPPSNTRILRWAQDYFGPYAGYAGQFIFCDRAQPDNGVSSGASQQNVRSTAENRKGEFNDHRVRQCPRCGALPGRHCKTPGGYYLQQGHKDRRSQAGRANTSVRLVPRARRLIRRARRPQSPGSVVRRRLR